MKAWIKGGLIGGLVGIVVTIMTFLGRIFLNCEVMSIGFTTSYGSKTCRVIFETAKIILFPTIRFENYILFYEFFLLITPVIWGVLFGIIIGFIIGKIKQKKEVANG